MSEDWRAAVVPDEVLDRPLGDLSATEFLRVLNHSSVPAAHLPLLADKKKFELWVEEDNVLKLPIREVLERIKNEKKKVELEVEDPVGPIIRWPDERTRLVEEIATVVEARLRRPA